VTEPGRPEAPCCDARQAARPRPWWRRRTVWAAAIVGGTLGAGRVWPSAQPVADALWHYLAQAGWALALGLLLGGLIDHFIPKEYIMVWLAGHRRRTIITAAGLGFLASSCSHGCLALTIELFHKGASIPSVITFLLASPWASLSLTLLLVSLLHGRGFAIVGLALVIAVITGFIFQWLDRRGWLDRNPHAVTVAKDFSLWEDLGRRWRQRQWTWRALAGDARGVLAGAIRLADMVLLWVALGFALSALLGHVIPSGWWSRWLGPTPLGLLATMGIATAMEVCSEGTAPLAVELYRQTGALGNAFAFLMGGVVTDFTELSMVWATIGRRTVFWMLVVTLPQVLLVGYVLNGMGR